MLTELLFSVTKWSVCLSLSLSLSVSQECAGWVLVLYWSLSCAGNHQVMKSNVQGNVWSLINGWLVTISSLLSLY